MKRFSVSIEATQKTFWTFNEEVAAHSEEEALELAYDTMLADPFFSAGDLLHVKHESIREVDSVERS